MPVSSPLIVAVERNRKQIEHLTAVATRVKAELRLADSMASALGLIEAELPDVILMPALLSTADELALGSRLRDLGASAAHVQTLTIPQFEPAAPPAGGRMLSFRRTRKPPPLPQGSAADSFANQLTVYLERATAIRRSPRRRAVSPGAFDPAEPRFAALIARLDELAQRA
jgi:CheY-like chemotaxis protein